MLNSDKTKVVAVIDTSPYIFFVIDAATGAKISAGKSSTPATAFWNSVGYQVFTMDSADNIYTSLMLSTAA